MLARSHGHHLVARVYDYLENIQPGLSRKVHAVFVYNVYVHTYSPESVAVQEIPVLFVSVSAVRFRIRVKAHKRLERTSGF